jgi:hypothetical protein
MGRIWRLGNARKLILILVEECQTKNGCETNKYRN